MHLHLVFDLGQKSPSNHIYKSFFKKKPKKQCNTLALFAHRINFLVQVMERNFTQALFSLHLSPSQPLFSLKSMGFTFNAVLNAVILASKAAVRDIYNQPVTI